MTVLRIWRDNGLEPHFKKGMPVYDEKQLKAIVGYEKKWGPVRTAIYAGGFSSTALRYWQEQGFGVRGPFSRLPKEQIAEIVSAHPIYGGNVSAAARNLPYCHLTIRKYWVEAGLPLCRRSQRIAV